MTQHTPGPPLNSAFAHSKAPQPQPVDGGTVRWRKKWHTWTFCPYCNRHRMVRADGILVKHPAKFMECPGSRRPPGHIAGVPRLILWRLWLRTHRMPGEDIRLSRTEGAPQ